MVKRAFDIVFALFGLALTSPVVLMAVVLVKLTSPGPAFYRGERIGRHGRPFRQWKLRTMVVDADSLGGSRTADNDPRITRIGSFLRKHKVDELPQLINVLAGEMSIVGPRPDIQAYVDLYSEEEMAILTLRPGITDWATLWDADEGATLARYQDPEGAYRREIHPHKVKLQLEYLRRHSLWVDARIIALTVLHIVAISFRTRTEQVSGCRESEPVNAQGRRA